MTIEVSAKKVDDAIKEGLKTLGATIDQVEVEVLSQGGLFKKAKIKMTVADADVPKEERPTVEERPAQQQKPQPKKEQPAAQPPKPVSQKQPPKEPQTQNNEPVQKPAEGQKKPKRERHDDAVELTPEIVKRAETFLRSTLEKMHVEAELKIEEKGRELNIDVVTDNSAVIGYRGETLDALEYLTSLSAGKGDERYVKVRLDSNNYRAKREESLTALAKRMADKCAATGRKVTLESMSSAHRRIIHAALGDDDRVITKSEGKDPNRRVVILPKRK